MQDDERTRDLLARMRSDEPPSPGSTIHFELEAPLMRQPIGSGMGLDDTLGPGFSLGVEPGQSVGWLQTMAPYVAPEIAAPNTDAPDTDAPQANPPQTDAPDTDAPDTDAPDADAPGTDAPDAPAPDISSRTTEPPDISGLRTEPPDISALRTEPPQTQPFGTEPLEDAADSAGGAPQTPADLAELGEALRATFRGDYVMLDEIGRGGMGVVYRAHHAQLRRDVALKALLTPQSGRDVAKATAQFVSEGMVAAYLEHPNIVPVHDIGQTHDGRPALAMKLIGGHTWKDLLHPRTPAHLARADQMDLDAHLDVLLDVCNGIAYAHSCGILHGDIKPENVLVGEFGEVRVVDWGVALDISDRPARERLAPPASAVCSSYGTLRYMAPEQAKGDGSKLGAHTDVFLLGATLFEIITGRYPYSHDELFPNLIAAANGEAPEWTEDDAQLSPELRQICATAMATDPDDRYPSVEAFQHALRDCVKHRQSILITATAQTTLDACAATLRHTDHADLDRYSLYARFAESVAGFHQALVLWPGNDDAQRGEHHARLAYADAALDGGDLGLAEAQLRALRDSALPATAPAQPRGAPSARRLDRNAQATLDALQQRLQDAQSARARNQRNARLARRGLILAGLAVVVVSLVSYIMIADEHRIVLLEKNQATVAASRAEASETLARQRLEEIQRLSLVERIGRLTRQSDALWPARPSNIDRYQDWLQEANAVLAEQPALVQRHKTLRAEGTPDSNAPDTLRFTEPADQWEYNTLGQLITDIDQLRSAHLPSVTQRLSSAQTLRKRSIEDYASAWRDIAANVRADPRFGGLELQPTLGLVPLGQDPTSRLWEFAHIQTGEVPKRDPNTGVLRLDDASAMVLVLLPGGASPTGAQPISAEHPLHSPNVDPWARPAEGPVHTVALKPFWIGKHEMTQGQWLRAGLPNPSAYRPGMELGGHTITLRHPVEQVRWTEAKAGLERLGLALPTEAQWEHATRGGTTTTFWTGDDLRSLGTTPDTVALNIADRYCRQNGGPGSWRYETWLNDGYVAHAPVGSFRPNPFGLHDVIGNVWEWCADRYGAYTLPVAPDTGLRRAPDTSPHVFRGGGFRSNAIHARSADRYSLYASDYRGHDVGVRAALNIAPAPAPKPATP